MSLNSKVGLLGVYMYECIAHMIVQIIFSEGECCWDHTSYHLVFMVRLMLSKKVCRSLVDTITSSSPSSVCAMSVSDLGYHYIDQTLVHCFSEQFQ